MEICAIKYEKKWMEGLRRRMVNDEVYDQPSKFHRTVAMK